MTLTGKQNGTQTRDKVMNAALDVFCEEGYSGASISKIAKASSVLPGSIYWMFESKEDLFAQVLKEASGVWLEDLTRSSSFPPHSVEGFGDMYRTLPGRKGRTPRFIQLIYVVAAEASARTERTLKVVNEVRSFWRARAESAIVQNIIKEDTAASRALAHRIASLSLNLADGAYISAQIDNDKDAIARLMPMIADVLERELRLGIENLKLA